MVWSTACTIIAGLLAVLLSILYIYVQRLKSYWKRRNVPTVGENVIFGIFKDVVLMKKTQGECYRKAYETNPDLKYYGTYFYGRPTLVVQDPDIVKQLLVKEFQSFSSHGFYTNTEKDPLSGHLFALDGAKWKAMRSKLSVTFTSGKMKLMFETMIKCIDRLNDVMERDLQTGGVIDMRDRMACLGIDIIASVAFGIEVNSLENPNVHFREIGRQLFTPSIPMFLRFMIIMNMHWLAKLFGIRVINSGPYNFIMNMVTNTVEYREKNNVVRNDFLNMMIQLKNKGYIDVDGKQTGMAADEVKDAGYSNCLTLDEIAAQVFIFYAAGFEPPSLLTTFTLYEISVHKDVQRKMQEECDRVLRETGGKITYEALQSMEYTDKVLQETLRFYPPMGALLRSTTKDCTLPLTDIRLDKNTSITIPVQGFHMDPRYFPDPEKYNPERFTEEHKASLPPYTYMPFGEGPRICIGMRFAQIQVKAVLLGLLSKYDFGVTDDTPVPMKLDPKGLNTCPLKVNFVVKKRAM